MVAPGGSCVQVALGRTVPDFDVDLLVGQGLRVTGSCAFSADTYAAAVDHLAAGRVSAQPLVSERVALAAAPDAFVRLRTPGELVGVLVQPWW
jgi:threonine dehydrogenase-like Zn-dependent dehydrogenase